VRKFSTSRCLLTPFNNCRPDKTNSDHSKSHDLFKSVFKYLVVIFLFSIPLKLVATFCGIPMLMQLILVGSIGCVNVILYREVIRYKNISLYEAIEIFFMSVCLVILTTLIGYPIIGHVITTMLLPILPLPTLPILPLPTLPILKEFEDCFIKFIILKYTNNDNHLKMAMGDDPSLDRSNK
jgi:type III secretory pathway component EscS